MDLIAYTPRATQIGFLAPFPRQWIEQGRDVGLVGRVIVGFETLLWYILIIGSLFCLCKRKDLWEALLLSVMLSVAVIIFLGLMVTNVGTIYRMRMGYLIPFYILGVHGLYSLVIQYRSEKS